MKRLHVHVSVDDLPRSIRFYSTFFAAEPTVVKPDYAKWMLDDPRVNFAISQRGRAAGLDHLGIQVEDAEELADVCGRLKQAEAPVLEQGATTCCYAESEKSWVVDPSGLSWEAFLTRGESTVYGDGGASEALKEMTKPATACCAPSRSEIIAAAEPASAKTSCCGPRA
jgi:catechol 2,3-dioxygenase-like lactoylglutathione lyase family enzyme